MTNIISLVPLPPLSCPHLVSVARRSLSPHFSRKLSVCRCEAKPKVEHETKNGEAVRVVQENSHVVPNKGINKRIALISVSAALSLFLFNRGLFSPGSVSLADLSANAVSYEEALRNGMPTVVEFYADWCEVCRELAPDVYKIEQEYKNQVNFVMLNVDNSKWEEEIDEFGVEGIPHFSFLDKEGNEEGNVVGRISRQYLKENIAALARGDESIPHSRIVGKFSSSESRQIQPVISPRSHGSL
eukprot:TRINITY_DN16870_c0_g1_i1.p1 TRINITY_DN16870_c0_g1~~TRINITY_DN16870_c0_g1_i1.p1  ORF type:complete len:243 (+),score=26.33 TRINITY_DN16870_c0_g1_i1:31-759(+)